MFFITTQRLLFKYAYRSKLTCMLLFEKIFCVTKAKVFLWLTYYLKMCEVEKYLYFENKIKFKLCKK